ncbi:Hypothetical predicted protein, partial [Paramuricea clavata]
MSIEDQRFIQIVESNIHKNQTGHWEMPLPLRSNDIHVPHNRNQASTRLKSLLRSFKRNLKMEQEYFNFMAKLFECGHVVPTLIEATPPKETGKIWYLPHFGVYHPRKPNKIRVVFDSSAEFKGTSLNKELLSGPDMHNGLQGILVRFRRNAVGVMCDIEQMFHNFHVHPPHRDLLRFLWFADNDKEKDIIVYQMVVHLFGNTSSPAVATFGLRKTAEEGEKEFGQDAKDFVVEDFYVDDGLTSRDTAEGTVSLIKNTQAMLATANLRLHKIASNSVEVMKSFPDQDRVESLKDLHIEQGPLPSQRSLGVIRRNRILVEACYLSLTQFMTHWDLVKMGNERWGDKASLGWDDPLPQPLQNRWRDSLCDLEDIRIPRCYRPETFGETKRSEIHAFSDASDKAIARLSPKQATTIPRLELCAAVLSAQAVKWITRELRLNIDEIVFYTDSRVVLGYIQNESRRFYVYWKYVETSHNPADIATRGKPAKQLVASSWFNGPEFLRNDHSSPTTNDHELSIMSDDPEVRPEVSTYSSEVQLIESLGSERFNRFSRWTTLRRALANLIVKAKQIKARRRGGNLSTPNTRRTRSNPPNPPTSKHSLTNPSAKELNQAENLMMKTAQADAFTPEIRIIQQSKSLKKSRLYSPTLSSIITEYFESRLSLGEFSNRALSRNRPPPRQTDYVWENPSSRDMGNRSKPDDFKENQAMRHLSEIGREAINATHGRPTTRKIGNATTVYQRRVRRVRALDYPNTKTKRRSSQRKTLGVISRCWKRWRRARLSVPLDDSSLYAAHHFFCDVIENKTVSGYLTLDAMFLELGSPQLTHELLVTLMAEITGIINSRPIVVVPSDIDQPQPLTPNMLLTMKTRPLLPPPGVFTPEDVYSRRHWRRSQYLADQFWTRWKWEYLQSQQKRTKWNERQPNLREGDIVIMKEQSPRNQWPLGRVVEAILSEDGKL